MRILIVTENPDTRQILAPVIDILERRSCEIVVTAIGEASLADWETSGRAPAYFNPPSADKLIALVQPDLVMTGIGDPHGFEAQVSTAANVMDKPLVWIETQWGAHAPTGAQQPAVPQLLLTVDGAGVWIAKHDPRIKQADTRIYAIGSPLLGEVFQSPVPSWTRTLVKDLQVTSKVILVVAQGNETTEILELLNESLKLSAEPCTIIPRLNRAWLDNTTRGLGWRLMLHDLQQSGVHQVVWPPDPHQDQYDRARKEMRSERELHNTFDLARVCDATVSAWSLPLTIAAHARKLAVCVRTFGIQDQLLTATGHARHGLVTADCAAELTEATPFAEFLDRHRESVTKQQDTLLQQLPFSPALAAAYVLAAGDRRAKR